MSQNKYSKYTFSRFEKLRDPKSVRKEPMTIDELEKETRSERMRTLVTQIRDERDDKKRAKLKEQLPLITPSGIFTVRSKAGFVNHSGFIVIDIDKIPDMHEVKERLKKVHFIYYCMDSPSGNGLKAFIKVKAKDEEQHLLFFHALENYFKKELDIEIDTACKDISRASFLSYDINPFWNIDSVTLKKGFIKKYLPIEHKSRNNTLIEIEDIKITGANYSGLIKSAVDKFLNAKDGEKHKVLRNSGTHLGYHINAGLLDFTKCFNALKEAIKLRKDELVSPKNALITLEKSLRYGIENPKPVNNINVNRKEYQFWYAYEGEINIKSTSYYHFLKRNGFYGFIYSKSRKLVREVNNVVTIVEKQDIIEFTVSYIRALKEDIGDGCNKYDLLEKYHNKLSYLTSDTQLMTFVKLNKPFLRDTAVCSYLFYKNGVLKITKDETSLINYKDVDGLIWESSIINRHYNPTDLQKREFIEKGDFVQFIKGITGKRQKDNKLTRYQSMRTIIGYLLHDFKDIVLSGILRFKKVTIVDGKNFTFNKTFAFQQVDLDTKILAFDDVKMNFDFSRLFSVISEGISVEKKNKDTMYIDYIDSPKVLITTNYMINGEGNSNERRRVEIEFSQHYNRDNTPYDEFGKTLFDDWNNDQWMYFDLFMVGCIQRFLKNGVIEPISVNIPLRKLRQQTSAEFAFFAQNKLSLLEKNGKEYNVKSIRNKFVQDYPDFEIHKWFTQNRFNKWLKLYGTTHGLSIEFRYSNNIQYVSYINGEFPKRNNGRNFRTLD